MQSTLEPTSWEPVLRRLALVTLCALFGLMSTASCVGLRARSTINEQWIRGGLNMVAVTVDPAYALAVEGCKAREIAIVDVAADGGDLKVARDQLTQARKRCAKIVEAFEEIRDWHSDAWAAIEDGKVAQAQSTLDKITEAWRTLQERTLSP